MFSDKFEYRKWQYYIIIGIISLIAVFFLPMVGSEANLAWKLPNTFVGWIVYVTTKLLIASINMLLFYCFMEQAKVNIKDNENYKKANEILLKNLNKKELMPMGPDAWVKKQYGTKGITIFATTILSAVGLTQAILTFDWISMLTYMFTIIMGVIFGVIQMSNAEIYWTEEYYQYALLVQEECAKKEEEQFYYCQLINNSNNNNDDGTYVWADENQFEILAICSQQQEQDNKNDETEITIIEGVKDNNDNL